MGSALEGSRGGYGVGWVRWDACLGLADEEDFSFRHIWSRPIDGARADAGSGCACVGELGGLGLRLRSPNE